MSFRKEEKLNIHQSKLLELIAWIHENNGYKLYENRIVSSTYFDTYAFDMHVDSEEGSMPRKKIRIRSYSEDKHIQDKSSLETKVSSSEGRYKTSTNNFDLKRAMNIGIFDPLYGICTPKVRVSYNRSYYKIFNTRLTIDQDIRYKKINKLGYEVLGVRDPDIIIEIKAQDSTSHEYLIRKFPFVRIRFSKYSRAINILNLA